MRRIIVIVFTFFLVLSGVSAQGQKGNRPPRFSPEKFNKEMRDYITKQANLTKDEANKFFPLYEKLQNEKRKIFGKTKPQDPNAAPKTEAECKKAILEMDDYEIKLKKIERQYHQKFLSVISARKLYDVIRAERDFHRGMFKGFMHDKKDRKAPQHK